MPRSCFITSFILKLQVQFGSSLRRPMMTVQSDKYTKPVFLVFVFFQETPQPNMKYCSIRVAVVAVAAAGVRMSRNHQLSQQHLRPYLVGSKVTHVKQYGVKMDGKKT